jgi:hypothetical protein
MNLTTIHRAVGNPSVRWQRVIGICDEYPGTNHVVAANFNAIASVDCDISIQVVVTANFDSYTGKVLINRPQPAPSRERI